jgi:hypothetical protein
MSNYYRSYVTATTNIRSKYYTSYLQQQQTLWVITTDLTLQQ